VSTLNTMFDQYGESPWLDGVGRSRSNDGTVAEALPQGIRGVTSTNASMARALAGPGYEEYFAGVHGRGSAELAEDIVVAEARATCDALEATYRESRAALLAKQRRYCDGLVSIEMSPNIANDRAALSATAARLATSVARANVMISIPATPEGLAAATDVLGAGISVNVSRVTSVARYAEVLHAWLDGLELALANGLDVDSIASTASFALAPVDVVYDSLFNFSNDPRRGTTAVATAAGIYAHYRKHIAERRARALLDRGAQLQRPLWTSSAPKNSTYFDLLYVNYIASFETVLAMSATTIDQVLDHGECATSMLLSTRNIKRTARLVRGLPKTFDHVAIAQKLEDDERDEALRSYEALIDAVQAKMRRP
jgi:transaldolase